VTDTLEYNKEDFELDVVSHFKNFTATEFKGFIDVEVRNNSTTFKGAVLRGTISYKTGRIWWLEQSEFCSRTKITKELVASTTWKLNTALKRVATGNQTVEEYARDRLEEVEGKLSDGEINESTYTQSCDWTKRRREVVEALLDCCSCCPTGTTTFQSSPTLRVPCLPCEWNTSATCVGRLR